MSTFDFAPFYRSTVGFDRLFSMLDQVGGVESAAVPGYPPYGIVTSRKKRLPRHVLPTS
jgi:molecular chaperone IbpA